MISENRNNPYIHCKENILPENRYHICFKKLSLFHAKIQLTYLFILHIRYGFSYQKTNFFEMKKLKSQLLRSMSRLLLIIYVARFITTCDHFTVISLNSVRDSVVCAHHQFNEKTLKISESRTYMADTSTPIAYIN